MPADHRSQRRRQPLRTPGSSAPSSQPRRTAPPASRAVEPPDYSRDYADVRRDLRMIAIISTVLLAGMIGVSFVM